MKPAPLPYEIAWQSLPEPEEADLSLPEGKAGFWIVCADQSGVARAFARHLHARGESCLAVFPSFLGAGRVPGGWRLSPEHREDFVDLLARTARLDRYLCRGLLYLWSLEGGPGSPAEPEDGGRASGALPELSFVLLEERQRRLFGGLLHLAQARRQVWGEKGPGLWIVTRGAKVLPGDAAPPAILQAGLWGLGEALFTEHPELTGGLLDLDPEEDAEQAALALLREVTASRPKPQVARRAGVRFIPRLAPRPAKIPSGAKEALCRPDGTYLIPGGLGRAGLAAARFLAAEGARRLVLFGRSELPHRRLWGKETLEDPKACHAIETIRALEAQGITVLCETADVADPEQMELLWEKLCRTLPPVRGIIYAARGAADAPLLALDAPTLLRALRPEVSGAALLYRLTAASPLDFFLLLSPAKESEEKGVSLAASRFLAALAENLCAQGLRALSVGWGGEPSAWEEALTLAKGFLRKGEAHCHLLPEGAYGEGAEKVPGMA